MEGSIMKGLATFFVILVFGAGIMYFVYTEGFATNTAAKGKDRVSNVIDEADEEEQQGGFGIDRVQLGADAKPLAFDGKRAMKYLRAICEIGPRMSGTKGMQKQQELIKKHFDDLGIKITYQTFKAKQNSVKQEVEFTNIIASFQPEKKRRVILCSHYDTRPIADQEPDPRDWRKPFVSANDGGSGVAILMELAHQLKDVKTNVGVDFVLFDGEEFIWQTQGPNKDRYFIGSDYFAKTWRKTKDRPEYAGAILLDMTAGKNMRLFLEVNSYRFHPELCKQVWGIANEQKAKAFVFDTRHEVQDDHLALQRAGIPAIDIIDFDYPHWHKLSDHPENCSVESMEQVAGVLSVWLQRAK
jgi:glutaminyl-peptide cyclotransferase